MKRVASLVIAAICTAMLFTSCEKETSTENLIGTWEWTSSTTYNAAGKIGTEESNKNNWMRITFTESTMTITSDELPDGLPQIYTVEDGTISTTGGIITYKIEKLTKNTLKLKMNKWEIIDDGTYTIYTYKRK